MPLRYQMNAPITGGQVSELREAVGWKPMTGRYDAALEKAYLTLSCLDGGRLAGFVQVVSNGSTDAYIQDVMVRPEYQGQGIGSQLLRSVLEQLRQDGIDHASLIFAPSLAPFYERFGFQIQCSGRMTLLSSTEENSRNRLEE